MSLGFCVCPLGPFLWFCNGNSEPVLPVRILAWLLIEIWSQWACLVWKFFVSGCWDPGIRSYGLRTQISCPPTKTQKIRICTLKTGISRWQASWNTSPQHSSLGTTPIRATVQQLGTYVYVRLVWNLKRVLLWEFGILVCTRFVHNDQHS